MNSRDLDLCAFDAAYPNNHAKFRLNVTSSLMQRSALVGLVDRLEPHLFEYNRGDLPMSVAADAVPGSDLSPAEVINEIGTCNSWMVIRNVEKDPDYAALTESLLETIKGFVHPRTGPILRKEAFVFVSSPGAVTPLHFDEEHNILMQVEGRKTVTVYSQHDRDIASQTDLERFHSGGHRNLVLDNPDLAQRGTPVTMMPGDALYIPPLAPHWVKVTDDIASLSLSVTWRSRRTMRALYLHQINHQLRSKGANPRFPGEAPLMDQLKIWREGIKRRLSQNPVFPGEQSETRDRPIV